MTACHSCLESGITADVGLVGYSECCVSRNLNPYIPNKHRSDAAEEESKSRVWEAYEGVVVFPGEIDGAEHKYGKEKHEKAEVGVLFAYENGRTLIKVVIFI